MTTQLSDPPGFTVERRVGCVIEARVFRIRTPDEATRYARALATVVSSTPLELKPILCADHRPVVVYSQPVTDRLTELFVSMNTRLQRIAILVSPTNAVLSMQLGRIVRQAGNEHRRLFTLASQALAHLSPVLDPLESARVRDFLDEFPPR